MTTEPIVFIEPKQAENTVTPQHEVNDDFVIIDKFTVTNTTDAVATFDVYLATNFAEASNANKIMAQRSIAANEVYTCPELVGHVLAQGDVIYTKASAADALTIRASGRKVT